MTPTLAGKKIAILVANGFEENQMAEMQRALVKAKADIKTVAPENGVVNGWQGNTWGHNFPVNAPIGEALGSDFDMLILPGGSRAIAKLKTNLHTRRIINHFIAADKPVAAIAEGVALLALSGKLQGRCVTATEDMKAELVTAGAQISDDTLCIDGSFITADGSDVAFWVTETMTFFAAPDVIKQAA
jgi:protease I